MQGPDELGYSSRGAAYNIVAKALREQTAEPVSDLRDLENAPTGRDRAGTGSPERAGGCRGWHSCCAADTANAGRATRMMSRSCRMRWVASRREDGLSFLS
jgi:hypothetical protein